MSTFVLSKQSKKCLWLGLIFALVARLICNAVIPLTDTTEARYAEIARKMLETGDWITPQHDYGVPFWAKPPLSTWLSAISMKLFGVNEFATRLPSTLFGIGTLLLIWLWCVPQRGRDFALSACAILAGMSLFFMADGAVMTDSSLMLCTTLAMISFWRALHTDNAAESKVWGYLFFVGLGLGLLAKGPLVGVLTFLPILPWIMLHKNWRQVWRTLPWIRGGILMLAISAPWYFMAENKTPGFLNYFIFGEHFGRFLNPGWKGDKYGNAHGEPLGMIWAFWLIATLPWSFIFIARLSPMLKDSLWRNRDESSRNKITHNKWLSYLLLCSFTPLVFFSFAHNIIWTYPLPTLPAFAVLTMEFLAHRKNSDSMSPRLAAFNFFAPVVLLMVAAMYIWGGGSYLKSSQKRIAEYYLSTRLDIASGLYYYHRRYYSGEFYSAGKAKVVEANNLSNLLENGHNDFLVIRPNDFKELTPEVRNHFKPERQFGNFVLLKEVSASVATLHSRNTLREAAIPSS